jgi:hypothetical protein
MYPLVRVELERGRRRGVTLTQRTAFRELSAQRAHTEKHGQQPNHYDNA